MTWSVFKTTLHVFYKPVFIFKAFSQGYFFYPSEATYEIRTCVWHTAVNFTHNTMFEYNLMWDAWPLDNLTQERHLLCDSVGIIPLFYITLNILIKILGIYIACWYESMHSTQVLDMYLKIRVLVTYMPGTYIDLSLQVCTVSIKL